MTGEVTAEQMAQVDAYGAMMWEVRWRVHEIIGIAENISVPVPMISAYSRILLCFVLLRQVCEHLAIGCFVAAHGVHSPAYQRLKKEYRADKIVRAVTRDDAKHYPIPFDLEIVEPANGVIEHRMSVRDYGEFSPEELQKAYLWCDGFLHAGMIKTVLTKREVSIESRDFLRIARNIVKHLQHHHILVNNRKNTIVCHMNDVTMGVDTSWGDVAYH